MDHSRKQRAAIGALTTAVVANKLIGKSLTESAFLGLGVGVVVYMVWDNSIVAAVERNISLMPVEGSKYYM